MEIIPIEELVKRVIGQYNQLSGNIVLQNCAIEDCKIITEGLRDYFRSIDKEFEVVNFLTEKRTLKEFPFTFNGKAYIIQDETSKLTNDINNRFSFIFVDIGYHRGY